MRDKPVNPVYSDYDHSVRQFLQAVASAFGGEVIYRKDSAEEIPQDTLSNLTMDQLKLEAESIPIINPDLPEVVENLAKELVDDGQFILSDVTSKVLTSFGWKLSEYSGWLHPMLIRRDALVAEINKRQEEHEIEELANQIVEKLNLNTIYPNDAQAKPREEEKESTEPDFF